ncbi:MAG TPA: aldo/keto reductase [Bryobacteraceae bacterium]|nr:aldo/keto reductase [Bryobacteraceae bacterium]
MLDRRRFIVSAAASCAVGVLPAIAAAPGEEWRNRQSGMAYRKLGRTGFMISRMVMGGNTIAPTNYEHVLLAMDMGLNYLDTAPAYGSGKSEEGYAQVLKSRPRDSFFLNTKVSPWDLNRNKLYKDIFDSLPETEQTKVRHAAQEYIEKTRVFEPDYVGDYFRGQRGEMEAAALSNAIAEKYGEKLDRGKNYKQIVLDSVHASLGRLGTDHVDILMCPHGASTPAELRNYPEILEAFEILKKQGKVRHLGVSAHSDPAGILRAAVEQKHYSVAMVAYSVVNHRFVDTALKAAHDAGLGVIAMKVARPVWSARRDGQQADPRRLAMIEKAFPGPLKAPQKAYAWALRNRHLSAVISELINAELVKENVPLAAGNAATA